MRLVKLFFLACLFWITPLLLADTPHQPSEEMLVVDKKSDDTPTPSKDQDKPDAEKKDDEQPPPSEQDEHHPSEDVQAATESYETAFIKTIVVLVGLLVLVILTVWMFKKISHGRLRSFNYLKSIKVIEKRPLSPKSMLYLIEVGGKQVLIAESQLEVRQVASLDWLGNEKDL